jgi:hypothetical protein
LARRFANEGGQAAAFFFARSQGEKIIYNQQDTCKATTCDRRHVAARPEGVPLDHQIDEEAAMVTKDTKTAKDMRVVRWFKTITGQKKTPYRWYEVDNCGL